MNLGCRHVFLVGCCLVSTVLVSGLSPHPKVMLISFDGFRYDLLNETMVPNIYKFAKDATWFVNGSRSQYITYTAPNHMGMITGLFEESHGIVSNYFYDPDTNQFFDYFNSTKKEGVVNASLQTFWYKGEPVWLTNERGDSSRRSASFYWPNSEAAFPSPPHRPSFYRSWTGYRNLSEWMSDVDEIIDAFTREKDPVNFVSWYVAEPDHTLHTNGFFNGALKEKLRQLDQLFAYMVSKFEDRGLFEHINVILTADHGHAEIKDQKHVMCIRDFLPEGGFTMGDHMIYPKNDEHAQEIFKNLTEAVATHGFDVKIYMKEKFPEMLNYKNTNRVGRIIIEPMVGSAISFSCSGKQLEKDYGPGGWKFNSSTHGMHPDAPEMRAMLLMRGPDIAEKQQVSLIPLNVDLYPLVCHLLKVAPAAHNGTLSVLARALKNVDDLMGRRMQQNVVTDNLGFMVFFLPPFVIVILYMLYGCRHTIMKNDPKWALNQSGYRPLQTDTGALAESGGSLIERPSIAETELGQDAIAMSGLLKDMGSSDDEF